MADGAWSRQWTTSDLVIDLKVFDVTMRDGLLCVCQVLCPLLMYMLVPMFIGDVEEIVVLKPAL